MGNPLITGTNFKQVNIMKKFTQMSKKVLFQKGILQYLSKFFVEIIISHTIWKYNQVRVSRPHIFTITSYFLLPKIDPNVSEEWIVKK